MTRWSEGFRRAAVVVAAGTMVAASAAVEGAGAKVLEVEVESRTVVLDGRPFGDAGPYEKISGRILFGLDPENPYNARIVDLDLAPRNADGLVEAWADFMVLRPVDGGRGIALVEVSNRGGKATLRYFNGARGAADPTDPEHFGDGLLMRRGLTLVWVGWQFDVPDRPGVLRLRAPEVRGPGGEPIEGTARADWVVDEATRTLALGHRGHRAYPVVDPDGWDHVLTVRDGREAPRRVVPRDGWSFAREEGGEVVPDSVHIHRPAGFEPGTIYELVYRARRPHVVGMGLAAIRDVASYAKHDPRALFPVRRAVGWGVSQTGRFLRHFLYQGFNTDEEGRRAYDGLLVHTAGAGRGSFNHRFAQPSRDAHRFSAFFYPTDIFPFTSRIQRDPVTGMRDGLLAHAHDRAHLPKVFYTNTGYEYWGRAAGLIHTSVDGGADVEPFPNERIYHLAGAQHFVGRFPREEDRIPGSPGYRWNPLNFFPQLRALMVRLVEWVDAGTPPPPSRHPEVAAGTLVPSDSLDFPRIPGIDVPDVAHVAYRADYGPRFRSRGIVDRQPPVVGPAFPALVPRVDSLGNEVGGIRGHQLRVPLATYTPWSLRIGLPGPEDELTDFVGSYIPLPTTEAERRATGDPRPSLETLYGSRGAYLEAVGRAAGEMVDAGVLLREDVAEVREIARNEWAWIHRR